MFEYVNEVEDKINLANKVQSTVDNVSWKIGATFNNAALNGETASGEIESLYYFLRAGLPGGRSIKNITFNISRNEAMYLDLSGETPEVKFGTEVAHSSSYYGLGSFYSNEKILLLANVWGVFVGAIAPHFLAEVKGGSQIETERPRLMAKKSGDDYFIYVQSTHTHTRYARYKLEYKDEPYASGAIRSNVKVHTLNQVMNVNANPETDYEYEYSEIVQSGAWDLALRESNVSDASGGIAHGDEIEREFIIFANGLEINDIPEEFTEYETLEFVAVSDVYRDSQTYYPLQNLCTHYKSFKFDANDRSMVMDSSIKMLRDVDINYLFLSMVSATRTYTNKALSNIDVEVQDLNNAADIHSNREGIDIIKLFGGNAPLTAEVLDMKVPVTATTAGRVSDAHYNKIYFYSAQSGDTLKNEDVVRAKTKVTIDIRA